MPDRIPRACDSSLYFFSSRRRHTRCLSDWSSDVCSSDLRLLLRVFLFVLVVQVTRTTSTKRKTRSSNRWVASIFPPSNTIIRRSLEVAGFAQRLVEIGRASCRERV